jgi:hypothetical protein
MWLYYFPYFVEGIVRTCRLVDSLSDPNDEFPTQYSYLFQERLRIEHRASGSALCNFKSDFCVADPIADCIES